MIDFKKSEFPVVSICCITYNHAKYIKSALDGFLKQYTDFDYEILIHDDCSTDGTTDIIKEYAERYPDVIFPLYEDENQWVKGRRGNIEFNYPRARGKYIALCEGDDYWTDEYKLQKQVDLLESNQHAGMCYTKVLKYDEEKGRMIGEWGGPYTEYKDMILKGNTVPTLSTLIRKDIYTSYLSEVFKNNRWKMGDYPIWIYVALKESVIFLNEVTGVYRILNESASHSRNSSRWLDFQMSYKDVKEFYLLRYPIDGVKFDNLEIALFKQVLRRRTLYSPELMHAGLEVLNKIENITFCKRIFYKMLINNGFLNLILKYTYKLYDLIKAFK